MPYNDTNYDPYSIDPMGNYTGFGFPADYTDEEERKKKQAELEGKVVHKQEVETRADGSQSITTTAERPAAPVKPVQPVMANQQMYNANIAQAESGQRPNIGYHNPQLSTAYGPYGTTAAGWADARRLNPALPQNITQATPEQLTQGQTAYTQQNAQYLQSYGVPVNEQTLSAAHFLGAKGLSDYIKTGYISPQAAAANGGAENVKRIVDQRLGGAMAPASGAAQPAAISPEQLAQQPQVAEQPQPQPFAGQGLKAPATGAAPTPSVATSQPFIDQYQKVQDDPINLIKLGFDDTAPEWIRDRARNRAADLVTQQREQERAKQELATATPSDLAKLMTQRTKEGSWGKWFAYSLLGMTGLRDAEASKLGMGREQMVMGADGRGYMVKIGPDGTPIEGFSSEGKQLTPEQLIDVAATAGQGKWQTSAEFFQDKAGNVFQAQHNDRGQTRMVDTKTGAPYRGQEKLERLRDVSKLGQMAQAQEYRRENFDNSVIAALKKKRGTDVLGALADLEAQSSTPLTDADRMAFIRQYGGFAVPGVAATAAPAAAPAAAVAPTPVPATTAPAAPAAVSPQQVQPTPQAVAGTNTVNPEFANAGKPGYDASGTPVRLPSEGAKAFDKRYKDWQQEQETNRKGRQEAVKKAQDVIGTSDKIVSDLVKTNEAITILQHSPTNFGTLTTEGATILPGEQSIGKYFKTQDYINTQTVLDIVNKTAASNAKMLGTNPTDRDLQFVTSTKPDENWSPKAVEEWLRRSAEGQRRTLDFARKQIQSGGTFIPETPAEAPAKGEGQWRVLSVQPGK